MNSREERSVQDDGPGLTGSEHPEEPVPGGEPEAGLFEIMSPWSLLLLAAGCLVSYQLLSVLLWNGQPGNEVWGLAVAPVAGILPVLLLIRRLRLPVLEALWLHPLPPRQLLGTLAATAGAIPIAYAASALNARYAPPDPEQLQFFQGLLPTGALSLVGGILAVVVLAPFAEEVLFRVLVLGVLARHLPALVAILLTGLLFGAAHLAPWILLPVSVLGIVLGFLAFLTQSITSAWLGHALFNLVAYVELLRTGDAETPWMEEFASQPAVLAAGVVLLLGGLRFLHSNPPAADPWDTPPSPGSGPPPVEPDRPANG